LRAEQKIEELEEKLREKRVNYNIWKPPPRGLFVLTKIFYNKI